MLRPTLISILLFSFLLPAELKAADAYRDKTGTEIYLPKNKTVIPFSSPGIWQSVAPLHDPAISTKVRKDGLENVRLIKAKFSRPVAKDDPDAVQAVYLLDKDGLIVGYHSFGPGEQTADFAINGVINYVIVVVECPRHGLWKKELRF